MNYPPGPVRASYAHQTRGFQHALHFSKCSHRFPKMFEQGMGENCVKMAIGKRETINASHSKRSIGLPLLSRLVLSVTDLARFEIDSKYLTGRDQLG
jgi:hypothetical protein